MDIASLTFIILVLPVLLLIYYCIPGKAKNVFLLIGSWLMYTWGDPSRLLFLWVYILYDFAIGMLLEKCRKHRNISTILLALSALLQTFGLTAVRAAAANQESFRFPIGIAVYTLQGLGYLISVYRGRQTAETSFLKIALYLSFFPVNFAGPLISCQEFWQQLERRRCNILHLSTGLEIFIRGLAEKTVLADTLRHIFEELRQTEFTDMSMLTAWLTLWAFSLCLYFTMLGYSEMARGISECLGLHLPRNFQHPFFSMSLARFAENWNTTVYSWYQRNFRHFLLGNIRHKWQKYAGLILMWTVMGAWYGIQPQFLVWGLCTGLLLTAEDLFLHRFLSKNQMVGLLYTFLIVHFLFILIMCQSFSEAGHFFCALLGLGKGFADQYSIYFFTSYIPILLASVYIAMGLFHNITEWLAATKCGKIFAAFIPLAEGFLLIFSLASMIYTHTDPTPILLI